MALRFGSEAAQSYVYISVLVPLIWVAVVATQRGYERRFLGTGPDEHRRLADATLALFALTSATSFVVKGELSRGYVMIALPAVFLLSLFGRQRLRSWLYRRRLAGHGLQRVLVVGREDSVEHLVEQLHREPQHGLMPVGACITNS